MISALIKETIREFEEIYPGITVRQINGGFCRYFATILSNKLKELGVVHQVVDDRNFRVPSEFDDGQFDEKLFEEHWPDVKIPPDLRNPYYSCSHAWVVVKGVHYDSESPEGVKNLFDLEIFKRAVQGIRDREIDIPSAVSILDKVKA